MSSSSSPAKRFRIAFSFAGEKRDFVKQVADLLAKRFGEAAILYDKYHEAEFANADLAFDLPSLYKDQADLIVSVFCPDYETKEWCGLEWRAIFSMIKEGAVKQIMLTRYDHTDGKGLHGLAGFIELDHKTPEQFVTLILERLALNEGKPKDHYCKSAASASIPAAASIPNNLPRLPCFFGRDADLKKIADAIAVDARGWGVVIDGPGGIGKSALAIRAAQLVSAERFKRIIFLSAKERELTADGQRALGSFVLPTCLEMLNAIARELEQPDLAKSPEAERPELILRALREKNVLLLLDNLETLPPPDRDQLFAFLNRLPQGSSAIVTSRRRADAGAVSLRLDRLDWDAARLFLAALGNEFNHLDKASEEDRRALYDETGGNPLLMRWVAGQLGTGRYRTVAAALDLLRRPEAGNNPLEFVFGDLLDTIRPNEIKVLAALTHFTLPIETRYIAELSGINEEAAHGALSDLSSRALVLPDVEERCFLLVPMVADFLRKKKPEVVAETGDRLEKRAYALIIENGFSKHERFTTLEAAWPGIAPALALFLAGDNARLQTVCEALQGFLNFQGRWDEWLALCEKAEARAVAAADHNQAGWRAYDAGYIHFLRQQADAVLTCAARAAAHWEKAFPKGKGAQAGARERAGALQLRGIGHRLKGEYPAAIAAYRESLDLHRTRAAESADAAIGLNDLATAEMDSGDLAAAEEHYREALRVARAANYSEGVTIYTGNLAGLALARKDWPSAETLARKALALSENIHRQQLIANNNHRLAIALACQGKASDALPYALEAVKIFTKLGSHAIALAKATLAECEAQLSAE